MTWASETISTNSEIRAMAIAIMNTSSSLMWIWTPLVLWPVTDAPYYRNYSPYLLTCTNSFLLDTGFTASCAFIIVFLCAMYSVHYIQKQDALIKRTGSDDLINQLDVPLLQEIK